MTERAKRLLAVAFLIGAVWIVFGQVRSFSFVSFDDDLYVTENPHVQVGFTREALAWAFTNTRSGHWHPVTWLSHMLDWRWFGADSGAHHTMNLLIHLANTLLLLGVLQRMTGSFWRSLMVAALFALHPLHAETVAWVADRKDLLCTGFALLSLSAYTRYARTRGAVPYVLSLMAFALSLMAKTMTVTLPVLLLLLDRWPLNRTRAGEAETPAPQDRPEPRESGRLGGWGPLILEKIPFLALSLGGSITALAFMGAGDGGPASYDSLPVRLYAALVACLHFLAKTVLPVDLAAHYTLSMDMPLWTPLVSAVLAGGISLAAILYQERVPYVFTGWFWFVIGMVPVSGLLYLGSTPMADRYTYLPHIGLFMAAVWAAADAAGRLAAHRSVMRVLPGLGVAIALCLALLCFLQARTWKDSLTLFERAVRVSPQSALAHNNLGLELASRGEKEASVHHFREAVRLVPAMAEAHRNLGVALVRLGRIAEAATSLEKAIRLEPANAEVLSYLARCYLAEGLPVKAEAACRKALAVEPGHPRALVNLGEALLRRGRPKEAEDAYRKGLRCFDGDKVRPLGGLATALAVQGRFKEAVAIRERLVVMRPGSGEAWYRLAVETFLLGDPASAVRYCDRARALGYEGVEKAFMERLAPYRGARDRP